MQVWRALALLQFGAHRAGAAHSPSKTGVNALVVGRPQLLKAGVKGDQISGCLPHRPGPSFSFSQVTQSATMGQAER
jgi:hypothetical protein